MTGKDYMQTQMALVQIGSQIQSLRLKEFLNCISNAEAAAWTIDPTLYQRALDNLTATKELAQTVLVVQEKFAGLQDAVLKTSMAAFIAKEQEKVKGS